MRNGLASLIMDCLVFVKLHHIKLRMKIQHFWNNGSYLEWKYKVRSQFSASLERISSNAPFLKNCICLCKETLWGKLPVQFIWNGFEKKNLTFVIIFNVCVFSYFLTNKYFVNISLFCRFLNLIFTALTWEAWSF